MHEIIDKNNSQKLVVSDESAFASTALPSIEGIFLCLQALVNPS
jgi:hypothetical protein